MKPTVIIDPGHGMSNRRKGRYDPGAVAGGAEEASIAMDWSNTLRTHLMALGCKVVRTRVNATDPAPVGDRAAIARHYKGAIMVSIHCNAANGAASGTETFYRGESNKALATRLNAAVCAAIGTRNRGAKTEAASQHARLAIMSFQPTFLVELGFIDHAGDRAKMLDSGIRHAACLEMAKIIAAAIA
jgi:N-acetylmuramoyl-L-alanine amidase